MARYKRIDTSPKFLPVDLSRQLLPGTFEHALNYLIDNELDLSFLHIPPSIIEAVLVTPNPRRRCAQPNTAVQARPREARPWNCLLGVAKTLLLIDLGCFVDVERVLVAGAPLCKL